MTEREHQLMEDFDLFEMGVLGDEDAAAMRRALAESDALRAAFLARDASDLLLGYSLREQQPSREARDNFMREIRHSQPAQLQVDKKVQAPRTRLWTWPAWTFATVAVLLAIATAILLMQNSEYRQTNQLQAAQLASQEQQLAQAQTKAQPASVTDATAILSVLQASDTARFVLTKAAAKPQPQIKTFFRRSTGQVVLIASNLPPVSADKTYELWMICSDIAKPMPAGMFRPDAQGNVALTMTQTAANHPAKLFAVTVEPANGSPAPTSAIVFSGAQGG
jgi:anti-sigma-K factor RskA